MLSKLTSLCSVLHGIKLKRFFIFVHQHCNVLNIDFSKNATIEVFRVKNGFL